VAKSTRPIAPAKRKKIIAEYAACGNYREVGRKYGISDKTVKNIVQNDPSFTQLSAQKAEEQTQDAVNYLIENGNRISRLMGKLLDAIESKSENIDMFTNIKDLATAFGIVADKAFKAAEIKAAATQSENEGNANPSAQVLALADLINKPQPDRSLPEVGDTGD
jgi:hypothetical protein